MKVNYTTIFSATVTIHGDPSVGISDHTFEVEHLDFDLTCLAEEDHEAAVKELREKLVALGKCVGGDEPVSVFLDPWDNEVDDDYDDYMDGDHESALASAGFGTDEDYGGYDHPCDWD